MAVRRAAQYLRMSTDRQQFSISFQASTIAAYASEHGYEIVRTYKDEGISGLNLKGRAGLGQLLADVVGKTADYDTILVYDVSRWGRFQDPDESAHYEYLCREAGVSVAYCAETFENDGSLAALILKSVKRVMAAEFSRELGDKVLAAQLAAAAQGFKQGGPAPYGLRRLMIDETGQAKQVLEVGEYKALRTDRTVTVPGPPDEIAVVRRIFSLFVMAGMTRTAIATLLNSEDVPNRLGMRWSQSTLTGLLTNEAYAGVLVFNKRAQRLGARATLNDPSEWVRIEGAIPPLIRREVFDAAQRAVGAKFRRFSDQQMLQMLRALLDQEGYLTWLLIKEHEGLPCPQTYRERFGSVTRAMELIGYCGLRPLSGAVAKRVASASGRESFQRCGRTSTAPRIRPTWA